MTDREILEQANAIMKAKYQADVLRAKNRRKTIVYSIIIISQIILFSITWHLNPPPVPLVGKILGSALMTCLIDLPFAFIIEVASDGHSNLFQVEIDKPEYYDITDMGFERSIHNLRSDFVKTHSLTNKTLSSGAIADRITEAMQDSISFAQNVITNKTLSSGSIAFGKDHTVSPSLTGGLRNSGSWATFDAWATLGSGFSSLGCEGYYLGEDKYIGGIKQDV